MAKSNPYDDAKNFVESFEAADALYKEVSQYERVPQVAASLALEEGDQTAAQILADPETPFENKVRAVGLSRIRANRKLTELVEKNFDDIIKKADKDSLERSLIGFRPKKNIEDKYKDYAKANVALSNLQLYEVKEKLDSNQVKSIVGDMAKDVKSFYDEAYKPGKDDSKEEKAEKKAFREFFLSLYFGREGKINSDRVRSKYAEIKSEAIEKFQKEVVEKEDKLKEYIIAAAPEKKEERVAFVRALMR